MKVIVLDGLAGEASLSIVINVTYSKNQSSQEFPHRLIDSRH